MCVYLQRHEHLEIWQPWECMDVMVSQFLFELPSPWYNGTGWLGVKKYKKFKLLTCFWLPRLQHTNTIIYTCIPSTSSWFISTMKWIHSAYYMASCIIKRSYHVQKWTKHSKVHNGVQRERERERERENQTVNSSSASTVAVIVFTAHLFSLVKHKYITKCIGALRSHVYHKIKTSAKFCSHKKLGCFFSRALAGVGTQIYLGLHELNAPH